MTDWSGIDDVDRYGASPRAPTRDAFEERFGLLVDRERLYRQNGRYRGLLREARRKVSQACVEDISYKPGRGLDKSQIAALAETAFTMAWNRS